MIIFQETFFFRVSELQTLYAWASTSLVFIIFSFLVALPASSILIEVKTMCVLWGVCVLCVSPYNHERLEALMPDSTILIDHMGRFCTEYFKAYSYEYVCLEASVYLRSLLWILNRICMKIKNKDILCACLFLFLCKLISGLKYTKKKRKRKEFWQRGLLDKFPFLVCVCCCAARCKVIRLRKWIPVVQVFAHFCSTH